MTVNIRRFFILINILLFSATYVVAQEDPYKAEIGVQIGGNFYSGDVNTIASPGLYLKNLKNIKPDLGMVFRYRFNKRLALRLGYDYTMVKGNFQFLDTVQVHTVSLSNPLHIVDFTGEFNFVDLENNPYKRTSKKVSPYIFAGVGWMLMPNYKSGIATGNQSFTIPFGIGVKAKLGNRWNFNIQWTNRLLFKDNLEGMKLYDNPAPRNINNPMNNDFLSGISIGFTYDFWTRDCDCNDTTLKSGIRPKAQKER